MEKKIYEVPVVEAVILRHVSLLMAGSNGQDTVSDVKSDDNIIWQEGGIDDDEPDC